MGTSKEIIVWGKPLDTDSLDNSSSIYLKGLTQEKPTVEWLWEEMDRVWLDKGLDNKKDLRVLFSPSLDS